MHGDIRATRFDCNDQWLDERASYTFASAYYWNVFEQLAYTKASSFGAYH